MGCHDGPMVTAGRPLGAVICEDDPVVAAALVDTINGLYGIEVLATLTSGDETIAAAAGARPDLVVVDLALAVPWGLGIVPRLIEVAPGAIVVVLVPEPFGGLRGAAVDAGAAALVELSDLRPLRACLERLHARVHAPVGCPCCAATGPSSARSGAGGSGTGEAGAMVSIRQTEAVEPDRNPPTDGGSSPTGRG